MSQTRAKGRKNRSGSPMLAASETPSQPAAGRKSNGPTPRTVNRGSAARKTDRKTWRIGLAVGTVLVVAIMIAIAVLKGNANGSNSNALTNPNGLSSNTSMLSAGTPAPDFDLATRSMPTAPTLIPRSTSWIATGSSASRSPAMLRTRIWRTP